MRNAGPLSLTVAIALLYGAGAAPAQPPAPFRIMITEVSWGEPDGVELTNFGTAPYLLTGWTVLWNDAAGQWGSLPLAGTLAAGEIMLVLEQNAAPVAELPPGVTVIEALPVLSTTTDALAVALVDDQGVIADEVVITDVNGVVGPGISGSFRGWARRGQLFPSMSVERIWGLDSDGGRDWSEEPHRSFGLENRSSGARSGHDPVQVQPVWINEIDAAPDLVEIWNPTTQSLDLRDWYLLVSDAQAVPLRMVTPWPQPFVLGPGRFVVLGDGPSPPPELPQTAAYVSLAGGTPLSLSSHELTIGLYDRLGRLVDLVRSAKEASTVVHNHPRAPSWPWDFVGAAPRLIAGDRSFGRAGTLSDTDSGADWRAMHTRSMGSANTAFVGTPGHADEYDVRINEGAGDGFTVVLNAGVASAGHDYSFFFSPGHLDGEGPFFGLGAEALFNWLILRNLPPFSATLDGRGSARFDFPPGTAPPGFAADFMFIVQLPNGILTKRTLIVEYDT